MSNMHFCPTCDRLFDNYNAAVDRAAMGALMEYDHHRTAEHVGERAERAS